MNFLYQTGSVILHASLVALALTFSNKAIEPLDNGSLDFINIETGELPKGEQIIEVNIAAKAQDNNVKALAKPNIIIVQKKLPIKIEKKITQKKPIPASVKTIESKTSDYSDDLDLEALDEELNAMASEEDIYTEEESPVTVASPPKPLATKKPAPLAKQQPKRPTSPPSVAATSKLARQLPTKKPKPAPQKAQKPLKASTAVIKTLPRKQVSTQAKQQSSSAGKFGIQGAVRDARDLRQKRGNTPPIYPRKDQLANKQGRTHLLAYVTKNGHVTKIKINKSSGSRLMDTNAYKAFAKYQFHKGQEGWVHMPFQFQISGRVKTIPALLRRAGK